MFLTDTKQLQNFYSDKRLWQGIPSIAVTEKGRIFVTFYSGGTKEEIGNYAVVIMSDGGSFSEPVAAAWQEGYRCFDPCLWIDPLGRLWFTWTRSPQNALYGVICDNPDADSLVWSGEFKIGEDVMMNKPTVLSTGEWMFPIAVWDHGIRVIPYEEDKQRGSFVYQTLDNGAHFKKIGGADVPERSFDEHMLLEMADGHLCMFVRTFYGIGVSHSYDGGKTWTKGADSGLGGPSSRFHIRRLQSGRILLVNHDRFKGRNNLTAMLSDDEGATWKWKLLLDERDDVSYPDAFEAADGYIYIVYDRERGAFKRNVSEAQKCAREILLARLTEDDIIHGRVSNGGSRLKQVVSKLGEYTGDIKNPYFEYDMYSDEELAMYLTETYSTDTVLEKIFDAYALNCDKINMEYMKQLDEKIKKYNSSCDNSLQILTDIIHYVRKKSTTQDGAAQEIFEAAKKILCRDFALDLTLDEIAEKVYASSYYLCHVFKRISGTTISKYRNYCRLRAAKDMLVNGTDSITDIANKCGFNNSSYFSKLFAQENGLAPTAYRQYNQKR